MDGALTKAYRIEDGGNAEVFTLVVRGSRLAFEKEDAELVTLAGAAIEELLHALYSILDQVREAGKGEREDLPEKGNESSL